MGLVDDLQTSLQLAKGMIDSTDVTNPVKITYGLKQLVKEATVGECVANSLYPLCLHSPPLCVY